ncbi:ankyrin repeat-containing domain protein [Hyaloraphidium curvatum]|nr:ankyrin repeat-containing domain protein [Hyaloraphidium curvatum]
MIDRPSARPRREHRSPSAPPADGKVDDSIKGQLFAAVQRKNAAAVRRLLADPHMTAAVLNAGDEQGDTVLCWVAHHGLEDIFRLLVADSRVNVNQAARNGGTSLMSACWQGHGAIVDGLLAHRDIDVNVRNRYGRTAVYYAAVRNFSDIVDRFLRLVERKSFVDFSIPDLPPPGADRNIDLFCRPSEDTKAMIKRRLARAGAKTTSLGSWLEPRHPMGTTDELFHDACVHGDVDTVLTMLAERKALISDLDVDGADENGLTAFHKACISNQPKVVEELLKTVDVNVRDSRGRTAYYYACACNHTTIIRLLGTMKVWNGGAAGGTARPYLVDVGIPDEDGRPPQHADVESLYAANENTERLVAEALRLRGVLEEYFQSRESVRKTREERMKNRELKRHAEEEEEDSEVIVEDRGVTIKRARLGTPPPRRARVRNSSARSKPRSRRVSPDDDGEGTPGAEDDFEDHDHTPVDLSPMLHGGEDRPLELPVPASRARTRPEPNRKPDEDTDAAISLWYSRRGPPPAESKAIDHQDLFARTAAPATPPPDEPSELHTPLDAASDPEELRAEVRRLLRAQSRLAAELARERDEHGRTRLKAQRLSGEAASLKDDVARAREQAARFKAHNAELRADKEDLNARLATAEADNWALRGDLERIRGVIASRLG